ncbi:MAG: XrtA system polysaccharide deacetylase [Planctomycetota bacterium]|jgi:polysaccharide deacetylase family protein (PEP-CTERM system associated)
MHITSENVIVEIVRDDQPVGPGEDGEIVVTQLDCHAMPFIRYRTGDVGSLSDEPCPCGRGLGVMNVVKGRSNDFLVAPDGHIVHGSAVHAALSGTVGIVRFQLAGDMHSAFGALVGDEACLSAAVVVGDGRAAERFGDQRPVIPDAPSGPRPMTQATHILSIDVEEYFHVQAAAEGGLSIDDWPSCERRLDASVDRILQLLAAHGATATFFVLGWVAEHEPKIVRRIAAAGHEIASHGMTHRMLGELTVERFRSELRDSRRLLEDLSGRAVVGYRAPTFSVTNQTSWALDVLAEEGLAYDSSIFPVRHDRYGIVGAPRGPHQAVGPAGGTIIELPPLTTRTLGMILPVGGGGYLRLLPSWTVTRAIRRAERAGWPAMLYLHPWELDPDQPTLPMSRLGRFRHRVNLRHTAAKLSRLLGRFRFRAAGEVLGSLSDPPTHRYG